MAYNVIRHFPGLPPLFPGSAVSAWPLGQVRILQSSYDDGQVDNKTKGGLGTGGGPELVLFCSKLQGSDHYSVFSVEYSYL